MKANSVANLGTIVGIWAHPDDETWSAAGLIALATANGQRVVCITATRGESGATDETKWDQARLGDIRTKELEDTLKILGVAEHHWLNYHDGRCAEVPDSRAADAILSIVKSVQPDTLLSFEPNGITGHPDHQAVSRWSLLVADRLVKKPTVYHAIESQERYETIGRELDKKFNIYFATDQPVVMPENQADLCLKLDKECLDTKIKALKAQASQTENLFKELSESEQAQMLDCECFVIAG